MVLIAVYTRVLCVDYVQIIRNNSVCPIWLFWAVENVVCAKREVDSIR